MSGSGERQSGRGWLPTSPVCRATQVGTGNAFLSHFSFIPIDRVTVKRVLQGWLILRLFCPIAQLDAVSISFYSDREENFIRCSIPCFNIVEYSSWIFCSSMHSLQLRIDPSFVIRFPTFNLSFVSPISRLYSKIWFSNIPTYRKSLEYFPSSIGTELVSSGAI